MFGKPFFYFVQWGSTVMEPNASTHLTPRIGTESNLRLIWLLLTIGLNHSKNCKLLTLKLWGPEVKGSGCYDTLANPWSMPHPSHSPIFVIDIHLGGSLILWRGGVCFLKVNPVFFVTFYYIKYFCPQRSNRPVSWWHC